MTLQIPSRKAMDLKADYKTVRAQSLKICAPLEAEDYVVQPITDVSPPKWHLGHITWFFENFVLIEHLKDYKPFDLTLNYFFNSYYESQGPRILRSRRGNITRPGLSVILDYRKHVDEHMTRLLDQFGEEDVPQSLIDLIILGLHHEQQHQELLLTDIKYILGHNPLFPVYQEIDKPQQVFHHDPMAFIPIEEGVYEVGHKGEGFCFDNEMGAHKVYLHQFEIQDRLVTNGEYLEFINNGGYKHFEHWLMEGIEWARQLEVKAPEYWFKKDEEWFYFSLNGGLQPLDLNAPVTHISYYEADAFARWKGYRLPTEFEWEVACLKFHDTIPQEGNFVENQNYQPISQQHGKDLQMYGNVWEWTSSAYLPYPNYPRLKGALGEYNGKFMVNQMVLRGGSCATPNSHIRPTYRNFFHADKRWQFTGLRLAK